MEDLVQAGDLEDLEDAVLAADDAQRAVLTADELQAPDWGVKLGRSGFFVLGALFSASIGYLGMSLAVKANVRVASAARHGDRDLGMRIAFRTGGVVGMATVGLGLLGASVVVLLYKGDAPKVLEGFGFGAALLAMFMRVGGGIFTNCLLYTSPSPRDS